MTLSAAYAISANSLQAELFREAPSSLIVGTGVVSIANNDCQVTQNGTPNASVNVAAGQAWVPGTLASTTGFDLNINNQTSYGLPTNLTEQGCYFVWNNGTVNLTVPSNVSGVTRYDIVVIYIEDAAYSGASNTAVLGYFTGSGGAPPSAPASSLVLAQITAANGFSSITNANIADKRPQAKTLPQGTPQCRVWRNGAYTDVNSTTTLCPFDTVSWDNYSGFSTSTHLYTVPTPGYYLVATAWTRAASLSAGQAMTTAIFQNGAAAAAGSYAQWTATGARVTSNAVGHLLCAAGDTISLYYTDYGGGGANTLATNCYMSIGKESS